MEEKLSKGRYLLITAAITAAAIINFVFWHNPMVGGITFAAYFIFYSFIFGSIAVDYKGWQLFIGGLLLASTIAIIGGSVLYFYQFNNAIFLFILLVIPAGLFIPYYKTAVTKKFSLRETFLQHAQHFLERKEKPTSIALVFTYLTIVVLAFSLLFASQTGQSIQSPFQAISPAFLPLYFIATVVLVGYVFIARRTKLPLLLLVIHYLLSTSVAVIVYKIGFGFDPFIHQAAEKIIAATGAINPKTPYYLGQYALVLFAHKAAFISIETIDMLLVPLAGAATLPLVIYFVLQHWFKKNYALMLATGSLMIPFTGLIMTTPQNLANIVFINTILLSLLYFYGDIRFWVLATMGLATTVIHPLAGIPLLVALFLFGLFKKLYDSYRRQLPAYLLTAAVLTTILPLAFLASGSLFLFTLPDISRADLPLPHLAEKFDLLFDLAYFIELNGGLLASVLIGIGIFFVAKHKLLKNHIPYLAAAGVLFFDFILIKYFVAFPALNGGDQQQFISRLSLLTLYILLPLFFTGLYVLIKTFWQKNDLYTKSFVILSIAGLITISLYLSYPRVDQYSPGKFYSLSESDIKAVTLIEHLADPSHVVLANQMIGAAAIKQFGFKKYYNGQFYYSMPGGQNNTLYQYYLDMIYQDAPIETMAKAINDAGVHEAYFVLNRYWRDADKIARRIKPTAQEVYSVDNDTVLIFKYVKN